jgi:hypothetical protein
MAGDSRIGQTAFMTERIQCAAFVIVVSVCVVLGIFFSGVRLLSVSSGVSIETEAAHPIPRSSQFLVRLTSDSPSLRMEGFARYDCRQF